MATHIGIVCPACQEIGKVRTTFLGRKIRCKHCGAAFRTPSHEEGTPTSASSVSAFEERMSGGRGEAMGGRAATLEASPEVLLAKLEARNQKYAVVKQQLFETRERCCQLECQVQEIRDEAERVREERQQDESLARDLEEARTERDRLGALVQDLEGRLAADGGWRRSCRRADPRSSDCGRNSKVPGRPMSRARPSRGRGPSGNAVWTRHYVASPTWTRHSRRYARSGTSCGPAWKNRTRSGARWRPSASS